MMRKIILVLALGSFAVAGCGNGEAEKNTKSASNSEVVAESKSVTAESEKKSRENGTIKLTKAGFIEKVMDYESNPEVWSYKGDRPALIDFYADWCGPCKIASPILEELAQEYEGEIYIYKVDTEVERELAAVFGIRSIPSFLFIPQEGRPTMSNGIARTPEETKEMFAQMIEEILLGEGSPESAGTL